MRNILLLWIATVIPAYNAAAQQFATDVEMITFDDLGNLLPTSAQRLDHLITTAAAAPPTDIYIAAHGWNNSFGEARASYRKMMQILRTVAKDYNLLGSSYRSMVIGISWPSKAWDEELRDLDVDSDVFSDGELLTLYRVFPPALSNGAYEQDIQTMQQLLAKPTDSLTAEDYQTAENLFQKYRLKGTNPDDDAVFFPATDADGLLSAGFSIRDALRLFTYWQMKERAGIVGRDGVRPKLVDRIQQAFPQARVHLLGHSFGCKLMLGCVGAGNSPARKIDSLVLLQGAVSYQALNPTAGYANVPDRVAGPILSTFSDHDAALGLSYEMASRVAGQVAELDISPYSAMGRVGPEAGQKFKIVGSQADDAYHLSSGIYCADGHDHIFNHSGFYNSAVGRLIWSAVLPQGNPDQAQEAVCDCAELGDFEVVDTDEQSLPRIVDRELREVRRLAPTDADVTNLKVFFGNLHSHTKYSDGTGTPEEAFVHARDQAQLDFLALTEHNHTSNMADNGFRIGHNPKRYEGPNSDSLIPVAKSLTVDDSFIAIFGQEVSSISQGNHLNVFDVTKVISDQDVPNGHFDDLLDSWLVSHLDTQGEKAIVQLNHPWTSSSPNDKEYGRDDFADFATWRQKLGDHAKLIEVANGPSHSDGVGLDPATVSATEFRRYLKMGFHLAPAANQDNHRRTWGTITDARTAILADSLSKQNLLNALRNRRAYATLDKNLRLIASVEGHVIGSIIQDHINQGHELALEVTFQDDDEDDATYWVEVFADKIAGEDANTATNLVATYGPIRVENNSGTATTFVLPGLQYDGWDYLYFKVDQGPPDSPQTQAYLAPVWFE